MAGDGGDVARADGAGRAETEGPGDLQAPVAEGLRALPRAGRPRVLAARRGPQQGNRGDARPAGTRRVLRDGSVRRPAPMTAKLDLYVKHKSEYAAKRAPSLVVVARASYLAIDGHGAPHS